MKNGKTFTNLMQAIREQRVLLLPAQEVPPTIQADTSTDMKIRYSKATKAKAKVVAVAAHS